MVELTSEMWPRSDKVYTSYLAGQVATLWLNLNPNIRLEALDPEEVFLPSLSILDCGRVIVLQGAQNVSTNAVHSNQSPAITSFRRMVHT